MQASVLRTWLVSKDQGLADAKLGVFLTTFQGNFLTPGQQPFRKTLQEFAR